MEAQVTKDMVNHPDHYNQGGIETIDVIKAYDPGYESFCFGSIVKYVLRYRKKGNPTEDLKKARFYINEILRIYDEKEAENAHLSIAANGK